MSTGLVPLPPIGPSGGLPATPALPPAGGVKPGAEFSVTAPEATPAKVESKSTIEALEQVYKQSDLGTIVPRPVENSAPPTALDKIFGSEADAMRDLPQRWQDLRTQVFEAASSGEPMELNDLLILQMEVQEVAFQVETASKVVEHGTTGTKTVLQTQA